MRRFATWMVVLMLSGVGAGVPRPIDAQNGTPQRSQEGCSFGSQKVTEVLLGQVPTGNGDEILKLTSFNFNDADTISVENCDASEVYHVDEGVIVFTFTAVKSGTLFQDANPDCARLKGCPVEADHAYTLKAGDAIGHTGPASYSFHGEAASQGGAEEASSGLDQESGDPRGTRGCNGRC